MLTAEILRGLMRYNRRSGTLTWLKPTSNRARKGDAVGWMDNHGYWRTSLFDKTYLNHRLIWLYVTGEWPSLQIDHRNTIRSDNRWSNLRLATPSQNKHNARKDAKNTSGYKGVHWSAGRRVWISQIAVQKKHHFLGHFSDPVSAHQAYRRAAHDLCGEFARTA